MRFPTISRRALALMLCLLAGPALPAAAQAGPYGIGDPSLDAQCPSGGPCPAAGWLRPLVHGGTRMSYARTGFPYDTAATADAAGHCIFAWSGQYSNPNPDQNGQPYWQGPHHWPAAAPAP